MSVASITSLNDINLFCKDLHCDTINEHPIPTYSEFELLGQNLTSPGKPNIVCDIRGYKHDSYVTIVISFFSHSYLNVGGVNIEWVSQSVIPAAFAPSYPLYQPSTLRFTVQDDRLNNGVVGVNGGHIEFFLDKSIPAGNIVLYDATITYYAPNL